MGVRYRRAVDLVELTGILQTSVTGLSIDEIAQEFGVSRRTAERMLSALRDRFPDLQPILRSGRKFWKLPSDSRSRPIQLPRALDALSERIAELEAEVVDSRQAMEELRGITEGLLATSDIGMLVVDHRNQIVFVNRVLAEYLGMPASAFYGRDLPALLRQLRGLFVDPLRFESRMLGPGSDGEDRFVFRIRPGADRSERQIHHWSRPITTGRFAGGRIERFADVGEVHVEDAPRARLQSIPETTIPMLEEHLHTLKEVAADVLESNDLAPEVARRLASVVQANARTVASSIEMIKQGGLKFEAMPPAETLQCIASMVRLTAEQLGIEVVVDADERLPWMRGDRALVVSNLALSAQITLEALPRGSRLTLRATLLDAPTRVRVSLLDDGPSLPANFPDILGSFFETRSGGAAVGVAHVRDANGTPTGGIVQYFDLPTPRPRSRPVSAIHA